MTTQMNPTSVPHNSSSHWRLISTSETPPKPQESIRPPSIQSPSPSDKVLNGVWSVQPASLHPPVTFTVPIQHTKNPQLTPTPSTPTLHSGIKIERVVEDPEMSWKFNRRGAEGYGFSYETNKTNMATGTTTSGQGKPAPIPSFASPTPRYPQSKHTMLVIGGHSSSSRDPRRGPPTRKLELSKFTPGSTIPAPDSPPKCAVSMKRTRSSFVSTRSVEVIDLSSGQRDGGSQMSESPLSSAPSTPAPMDEDKSVEVDVTPMGVASMGIPSGVETPGTVLDNLLSDYVYHAYLAKLNALDIHALDLRVGRLVHGIQDALRYRQRFIIRQQEIIAKMKKSVLQIRELGCTEAEAGLREVHEGIDGIMREIFKCEFGPMPEYDSAGMRVRDGGEIGEESASLDGDMDPFLSTVEGWLRLTKKISFGAVVVAPHGNGEHIAYRSASDIQEAGRQLWERGVLRPSSENEERD